MCVTLCVFVCVCVCLCVRVHLHLPALFSLQGDSSHDVEIDLDEVLDIEDDNQRKQFLRVSRIQYSYIDR